MIAFARLRTQSLALIFLALLASLANHLVEFNVLDSPKERKRGNSLLCERILFVNHRRGYHRHVQQPQLVPGGAEVRQKLED